MSCVFHSKGFGHHPQAEFLALQSSFAVGDQCFEEIRSCLVEETKVCAPRHVADDVDSGFSHLGGHRGYLSNYILESGLRRVRSRTELQNCSVESAGITSGMERPTAPWLTSPRSLQSWVPQPAFGRETSYRRRLSANQAVAEGWLATVACVPALRRIQACAPARFNSFSFPLVSLSLRESWGKSACAVCAADGGQRLMARLLRPD